MALSISLTIIESNNILSLCFIVNEFDGGIQFDQFVNTICLVIISHKHVSHIIFKVHHMNVMTKKSCDNLG